MDNKKKNPKTTIHF
jgi:hypothetical protein